MTATQAGSAPATSSLPAISLVGLFFASAQAPLGSTLISVALPSVSEDLGVGITLATHWLVTGYLIANIVAQSPGGRLADAVGSLRAIRIGMLLQAAGALACMVGGQLALLVAARGCTALGGALLMPATVSLIRARTPEHERGRMFGWLAATVSLAAALGPPLGGELLHSFGWRALFGAQLVLFCIAAALLLLAWPSPAEATPQAERAGANTGFDVAGALLMAVGLAPLLFAGRDKWPAALGASALVLALFVTWERRCQRPLVDPQLFHLPGFAVGTSATALQSSLFYGLLSQLPIFMQHVLGQSPSVVGRTLFALMGAVFVMAPLGGRLCDRLGPRRAAYIGLAALLVGLGLLQRLAAWTSAADAVPALIGVGSGFGLLNAPLQTATLGAVPAERAGSAAGVAFTLRYFGGVLGMFMLKVLLEAPGAGNADGMLLAHQGAVRGLLATGVLLALVVAALPQSPQRAKR